MKPEKVKTESLWTIEDLAAYLRRAVATIYSDLGRAQERVPPPLPRRGGGGLRWDPDQVRDWVRGEDNPPPPAPPAGTPPRRPKRGRPTKAESAVRRARASDWKGGAD